MKRILLKRSFFILAITFILVLGSNVATAEYVADLNGVAGNSCFETCSDGSSVLSDVILPSTCFDWVEVSGADMRVFDASNNGLLPETAPYDSYCVEYDTDEAIQTRRLYNLKVDMGFFTTTGGEAAYSVQLGITSGGTFTLLATDPGVVTATGVNLSTYYDDPNEGAVSGVSDFLYVSGPADSGTMTVRLARTGGDGRWFGFDNIVLEYVDIEEPVILEQPQDGQYVKENEPAVLGITAVYADNYQWYKSADDVIGGDTPVGTDSNSLTIANMQASDEGYYYCKASNTYGDTYSDVVRLLAKRLVSRWDFEDNMQDSIGDNHGSRTNPSAYVTGVKGAKAMSFSGVIDDRVVIPFDAELNRDTFTLSAWAKVTGGTSYRGLMSTANSIGGDEEGYIIYAQSSSTNIWSFWTGYTSYWHKVNGPTIVDDEWVMVSGTYDAASRQQRFYINGLLVNSLTISESDPFVPNSGVDLFIGAAGNYSTAGAAYPFVGAIDDVRYYSGALTAEEVAQIYVDLTQEPVCIPGSLEADFNGDCTVNFEDFAELATEWLVNNLVMPN